MSIRAFIILLLLCAAFNASAQKTAAGGDTVLKGATIEVVQSYKPQVKQVPKPEWVPQLPPNDTARPSFKYDVPVQTLYYSYSSLPIRPLALGIDSGKIPFENYVKLGGGNLSTIYLDAGIGGVYGPGYATSIHLHHISQQGNINYEQTALSGIEAEGMLYRQHNDWHASIDAERNQYYYYAYPDHEPKDTLKQTYTTIRASVDMKNKDSADGRINYHPSVNASLYNARFGTSETTAGFNAPFTYNMDTSIQLMLGLNGKLTEFKSSAQNESNNYIELLPGVNFHLDELTGHALLGLAAGKNGGYVLPDIYLVLPIAGTIFVASAGWQATLLQNTYEQLTTDNPYLLSTYQVMQSRKDQVFVNLEGNAGHHLFFSGRLSWNNWDELPTYSSLEYVGFNTVADTKRFNVLYQQVQAISFQAAARYKVANTWSAGICGDFYNYYHSSQQHVWEQPEVKIKGDFMISPIPKLTVTAYLAALGGVYAQYDYYESVKLKTFIDIGGNAEYQVIPRLSAFIQVSNLLNDRYQRWIGYEAYGINVYGGLRLKF